MLKRKGGSVLSAQMHRRMLQKRRQMSMDWNKLRDFLHTLGVEWGGSDISQVIPEEPLLTVLQRAHDHDAFYRIDWLETTGPELLVLLPNNQTPLKFHFYRVQLSETHPLGDALTRLLQYQGSDGFEQRREIPEWHLLHAMVETMKALFWAGQDISQFPPEIIVQKIC
jgi:hypothetical protein